MYIGLAHVLWNSVKPNKEKSRAIAEKWGIPGYAAHLLATRGFETEEEIGMMLGLGEPVFSDPFLIKDMDKAVSRIEKAIDSFENVAVFGDYDVDGVTSAAMVCSFLEMNGANVYAVIPDRETEGYGMKKAAIDKIHERGTTLIITVDNGISAIEEIEYASSLGIDVVVTDHHQPGDILPKAVAVVNPHRQDDTSPFKLYSGVGVAFKLLCAMCGDEQLVIDNYIDLAALGTVADVVPLLGENRTIVSMGLEAINRRERIGIDALCRAAGAEDKELTAADIAFTLAPRINAAGRMGSADRALRLLMSEDYDESNDLANELNSENISRHNAEKIMLNDTAEKLAEDPSLLLDRVIVIDADDWNKGIIGIFASRICEGYGKPCFIISRNGEISHGSGRSIAGFSLYEALCACSSLLEVFGGHEQAAGLTIKTENIPAFRKAINEYAAQCEMPMPAITIDCELAPKHLNFELVDAAVMLEPFGEGNRLPMIGLMNCRLTDIIHLKEGKHQKLILTKDCVSTEVMLFGVTNELFSYRKGDMLDVAVKLSRSHFRGKDTLMATVAAIKPSGIDRHLTINDERLVEAHKRGEKLTEEQKNRLIPERSQLETVYRLLRSENGFAGDTEALFVRLNKDGIDSYARLLIIIEALFQSGLLEISGSGAKTRLTLCKPENKVDIFACDILKRLM